MNPIFALLIGLANLYIGIYILLICLNKIKTTENSVFLKHKTLFLILSILLTIRGLYKVLFYFGLL